MSTETIVITSVIGTGDPLDAFLMLPLIAQWGARRACATEQEEPCVDAIRRMVILAAPGLTDDAGETARELAYCEPHYQSFIARARLNPTVASQAASG